MKLIFLFVLFSLSALALDAVDEERVEPGDEESLPCTMSYIAGTPEDIEADDQDDTKTKSSSATAAKSQ